MSQRTESGRLSYGFIAKATLLVILLWALSQAAWLARDIAFIGFAAVLVATLFSLAVDRLDAVLPRWAAAVLVLVAFLGVLFGIGFLGWPALEGQVSTIRQEVPRLVGDAFEWVRTQYRTLMPDGVEGTVERPGQGVVERQPVPPASPGTGAEIARLASGALPLLNSAVGALTGIVVVLFAAVFLVIDPEAYLRGVVRLVPAESRDRVEGALRDAGATLKRWLAGMTVSMAIIFTTSTVGLWLLGVPAPVALGLIAGILVFVPFIGPILSAVPALALAFTVSPILAVWTALLYTGIQVLESNLLTPMVMREAVDLQPAATILFQLAMGVLFGFLGVFLAVPLFAVLQVLVDRLYVEPMEQAPAAGG